MTKDAKVEGVNKSLYFSLWAWMQRN